MLIGKSNNTPFSSRSRAQSMLEFAIIIPFLILLILGALDFGRIISTKICLKNASREGASYLAANPSDYDTGYAGTIAIIVAEGDYLNYVITTEEISIDGCCTTDLPVSVTITKNIDLIFGNFLSALGIIDDPFLVSSTVSMMVQ